MKKASLAGHLPPLNLRNCKSWLKSLYPENKPMITHTHHVNLDITDAEFTCDIAVAISEAMNKRLQIVVKNNHVLYRVTSHYETVLETRDYKDAEAAYNNCE